MKLRTLIITSCTGEKLFSPPDQLTAEDFQDPKRLEKRKAELESLSQPACQMYQGAQHLRVMEGLSMLRQACPNQPIDLMIVSAGFGLLGEHEPVVPYEMSFSHMKASELDRWAAVLSIHQQAEQAIEGYDLIFLLLGKNYLKSLKFPIRTRLEQTFVCLASSSSANLIQGIDGKSLILSLSNADAKRYRYGLVGLKGFLFYKFAQAVRKKPDLLGQIYNQPQLFQELLNASS